ncbi:TfoX/Sxy family protein [Microbacterium oxydans]|uniref:TfoX/Sxy family protein n=1 Tax=Microbacterium oxydans TaxID=82380 RepID=UPI00226B1614|nr:TfoX/Sxy family protein [Microbacterium oxydans]WAA64751.1 TfoX/Sxy family protein [Microbacterium oxydans]
MDAAGNELADRIRALLSADDEIEERRMFGTRAFLDDGRILLGARSGGVLLVRVDDESGAALLTRPGVARAVMGSRTMGSGWLDIVPAVIEDDAELMFWLDVARESTGAAVEAPGQDDR